MINSILAFSLFTVKANRSNWLDIVLTTSMDREEALELLNALEDPFWASYRSDFHREGDNRLKKGPNIGQDGQKGAKNGHF